jgi:hypothetical protein
MIMLDTRAHPYRNIYLSSEQEQLVAHFSVTQQLGFKPVLHCPCGASLDLNLNPKRVLQAFNLAHADCISGEEASWADLNAAPGSSASWSSAYGV